MYIIICAAHGPIIAGGIFICTNDFVLFIRVCVCVCVDILTREK